MNYTLPRGTKDILPDEVALWQRIESIARELCDLYQYKEIRTPIFEMTDLFIRGLGDDTDIVEKEMYTFEDKGKRSITLRPEGTAPVVRSLVQHNLIQQKSPQKLFYIGPMFRYERPQAGRYRQFHQIGFETIGSASPCTDAELIALGVSIFDRLGLENLSVTINSVGCKICRPVIEEQLKQFIGSFLANLCENCKTRFDSNPLRILDCKNKKCNTYFSGLPDLKESQCRDCKDHFGALNERLDQLGIAFSVNHKLVRGLDYYTRTAFEILSEDLGAQNAVCGGGRYDDLIEQMGGKPTPAMGFAFGIERVVLILQSLNKKIETPSPTVLLAPIGSAQKSVCFRLLYDLREAGISCEMDFDKETLKQHLKVANKVGASYALIFGEEEAENQELILKDLTKGTQQTVPLNELMETLSSLKGLHV